MAFNITSTVVGFPAIGTVSTSKVVPLGTIVEAVDPTYGAGTFVFLAGAASTAAGNMVTFNPSTGATTRAVAAARGLVGIATAATVASTYGWYQVRGNTLVTSGTVVANKPAYLTATPSTIDDAVVSGDKIDGLITLAADSGGTALCALAWPACNGNG